MGFWDDLTNNTAPTKFPMPPRLADPQPGYPATARMPMPPRADEGGRQPMPPRLADPQPGYPATARIPMPPRLGESTTNAGSLLLDPNARSAVRGGIESMINFNGVGNAPGNFAFGATAPDPQYEANRAAFATGNAAPGFLSVPAAAALTPAPASVGQVARTEALRVPFTAPPGTAQRPGATEVIRPDPGFQQSPQNVLPAVPEVATPQWSATPEDIQKQLAMIPVPRTIEQNMLALSRGNTTWDMTPDAQQGMAVAQNTRDQEEYGKKVSALTSMYGNAAGAVPGVMNARTAESKAPADIARLNAESAKVLADAAATPGKLANDTTTANAHTANAAAAQTHADAAMITARTVQQNGGKNPVKPGDTVVAELEKAGDAARKNFMEGLKTNPALAMLYKTPEELTAAADSVARKRKLQLAAMYDAAGVK